MSIVVATDFSANAAAMCALAANWARRLDLDLVLLHVVADPELAPALTQDVHADVQEARQRLDALASGLPAGTRCGVEVRTADSVAKGILHRLADRVQWAFLATSNRSLLDRLRLGSVAVAVLRASPVPLVCFPPHATAAVQSAGASSSEPQHIVLTTDLSADSRRAFAPTVALARRLGMRITLVSVLDTLPFVPADPGIVLAQPSPAKLRSDTTTELARIAREIGPDVCTKTAVVESADAATAICEFTRSEAAALLAIATHGRSGLRRLLLGSVAESVLRSASVPALVFPPAG